MNKHFDETQLIAEYGGDMDILREVANVLIADTPGRLDKLTHAVRTADFHELQLQAHTLKGSFKLFYAAELTEKCWQLEKLGRDQSTEGAAVLVDKVSKIYQSFIIELNKFIKEPARDAS